MDWLLVLGVGSALLALVAFVGNQYRFLPADGLMYDFINFVSAAGLFFYAYQTGAVPFMITNSVWALVSGIDVLKDLMGRPSPRRGARRAGR